MKKKFTLFLFIIAFSISLNAFAEEQEKFTTCVSIGKDFRIMTDQKEVYLPLGVSLKEGEALRDFLKNLIGKKLKITDIQSGKPVSHAKIYFTMDESAYESMMGRIFVEGRAPFPKEYFLNKALIEKGLATKN